MAQSQFTKNQLAQNILTQKGVSYGELITNHRPAFFCKYRKTSLFVPALNLKIFFTF
jgi:hypothetical protein